MDIPASWLEQIQNIDWVEVREKIQDYGPALKVLQGTWTRESLQEMSEGKLFVPDEVLNDALAERLTAMAPKQDLKSLTLTSHKNGKLDIEAETEKEKLKLSGEIKEFVHKGDKTYMVYHVSSKRLPGHGLMSWLFSQLSLSMVKSMVGDIQISEALPLEIHHNDVSIDCSRILAESDFGKTTYKGHRLLDLLEIKSAEPREGGIMFATELHIPDDVKADLKGMLGKSDEKIDEKIEMPQEE